MRWYLTAVMAVLVTSVFFGGSAHAQSLEIHPTIYQDVRLKPGERKKAYVDVVSSAASPQVITMTVQAFRQTDDSGALAFYDDTQVKEGIKLDLTEFELAPHEAIRIYFMMDGSLLPSGDVFAAIFARTAPKSETAAQAVQVGSLLAIVNGTPPSHRADVSGLDANFLQIGDRITASIALTNPAAENTMTGFFPDLTVEAQPYTSRQVKGPLLFAGRTRTVEYRQPGDYFGLINLKVDAGGNVKSQFIFVVTGYWRWLAPALLAAIVALLFLGLRLNIASKLRRILHK